MMQVRVHEQSTGISSFLLIVPVCHLVTHLVVGLQRTVDLHDDFVGDE
jgi:hypothetical protein